LAKELYIGIMTGTSLDAIDTVLCSFESKVVTVHGSYSYPWPDSLRSELLELSRREQVSIDTLARCHLLLPKLYADAVGNLLKNSGKKAAEVKAIGLHGQTIRHLPKPAAIQPDLPAVGATIQLGSGTALAAITGIDVIHDFRSADVALGGNGAPLVPMFDVAFLHSPTINRLVVNIGGISNITWIPKDGKEIAAFDTGPGNMILDGLAQEYLNTPYDEGGNQARSGQIDESLFAELCSHPYFKEPPPKSTGRELFGDIFLSLFKERIAANTLQVSDALATATELTAYAIVNALSLLKKEKEQVEIIVSGGGTKNQFLLQRLSALAQPNKVIPSDDLGIPSQLKEAIAFAFFAEAFLDNSLIHLPRTTGASHAVILGSHAKGR